jgi:hypothetical protein
MGDDMSLRLPDSVNADIVMANGIRRAGSRETQEAGFWLSDLVPKYEASDFPGATDNAIRDVMQLFTAHRKTTWYGTALKTPMYILTYRTGDRVLILDSKVASTLEEAAELFLPNVPMVQCQLAGHPALRFNDMYVLTLTAWTSIAGGVE